MNVLQFGYGNYGKFHAQAWLELGHTLTIVDPNRSLVSHRRNMKDLGLWKYTDDIHDAVVLKEQTRSWEEYTDIVDIVTSVDVHPHLVRMANNYSIPYIFCEKPFCKMSIHLTDDFKSKCYIGYGYRFVTDNEGGMEKLKGKTELYLQWYGRKHPEWSYADLMWNDGVHVFDLFKYLVGRFPRPDEYFLSNTREGFSEDPVVAGTITHKSIRNKDHIVVFSTVDPVELLKEQFTRMIERHGEGLHTIQDSIELHHAIQENIQCHSPS